MNTSTIMLPWAEEHFRNMEAGLNGEKSGSLHSLRKTAFEIFSSKGLPSPRTESWKYTNLRSLTQSGFSVALGAPQESHSAQVESLLLSDAVHTCIGVNGHILSSQKQNASTKGLTVLTLKELFKAEDELAACLKAKIGTLASIEESAIAAFNSSFVQDGVVIHLAKETILEQPIQIVWYTETGFASYPRILLVLDEGASCQLVENYAGAEGQYLSAPVTEVFVSEGAELEHIVIQEEGDDASRVALTQIEQASRSRYKSIQLNFGGNLVRNEIEPLLNGEEIHADLIGLNILRQSQHVDNTTLLDHAKPNSESHELYKGVYADSSSGIFNGTIIVRPDAQKTNAIQSNQSLLLSDSASSKARPQLKIWADDVKCTHGATVGQLEDDALFYLRARGIGKETARAMLITAFAEEVIGHISSDELRTRVDQNLHKKLDVILQGLAKG